MLAEEAEQGVIVGFAPNQGCSGSPNLAECATRRYPRRGEAASLFLYLDRTPPNTRDELVVHTTSNANGGKMEFHETRLIDRE